MNETTSEDKVLAWALWGKGRSGNAARQRVGENPAGFVGTGPCGTVTGIQVSQAGDNLAIDDE